MSEVKRETIHFSSARGRYGCFSNFAVYPVRIDGKEWPTCEHYYQSQKFEDPRRREAIRRAKTPSVAASMGRNRRWRIRPDWHKVRPKVMRNAVEAKFDQHPELVDVLLETRHARIVERSDKDGFWGDGTDGRGGNNLGNILMLLRSRYWMKRWHKRAADTLRGLLEDDDLVNRLRRSPKDRRMLDEAERLARVCEGGDPPAEDLSLAPLWAQAMKVVYRRLLEQDQEDSRGVQ